MAFAERSDPIVNKKPTLVGLRNYSGRRKLPELKVYIWGRQASELRDSVGCLRGAAPRQHGKGVGPRYASDDWDQDILHRISLIVVFVIMYLTTNPRRDRSFVSGCFARFSLRVERNRDTVPGMVTIGSWAPDSPDGTVQSQPNLSKSPLGGRIMAPLLARTARDAGTVFLDRDPGSY